MFKSAPEFIADFKDKVTGILIKDIGLDDDNAKLAAQKLADYIKSDWSNNNSSGTFFLSFTYSLKPVYSLF